MADKCRRAKGATLQLCESAAHAVQQEMVRLQHMRETVSGNIRQRLAIVKGKTSAPLFYCPWCRADIDTRPTARTPAQEREPAPASRDCTRPECMARGCFGHCMKGIKQEKQR